MNFRKATAGSLNTCYRKHKLHINRDKHTYEELEKHNSDDETDAGHHEELAERFWSRLSEGQRIP